MDIKSILTPEVINYIITIVIVPFVIKVLLNISANIKTKTNNQKFDKYIDIAEKAIETIVTSVSQTYVDSLKKSGTFDDIAKGEAFKKAKESIITTLSDTTKQELSNTYGDLDKWIDSKIEYYVSNKKAV